MSILNDLFEQIIQSEERIRERFSKLREVNSEIQGTVVKYQDFTDELKSLKGLLREKSYREELNISPRTRTRKKTPLKTKNEEFTADVVKFTAQFDFCERGNEKRMTEATKQIEALRRKEDRLKQDMASVKQTQEQITSQLEEKNGLSVNNSRTERKLTALTIQIQNANEKTRCLQADKKRVAAFKPHNNPEFKRFQVRVDQSIVYNKGRRGKSS
ncbi:hypothetical protein OS493_011297 [Desmophyllum pertusum]|uniref:Coiled-coil domain-containing protein 172 n=1 Tax=Desmophyllum pertusum TaxID=174260 RepID=A0A9W9Z4N2_9CNID|nr:hypothetical protein OS493_011297 [Desmophyllum pertusum]